jgi:hypothetical protein
VPFDLPEAGFNDYWRVRQTGSFQAVSHRSMTIGVDGQNSIIVLKSMVEELAGLGGRKEHGLFFGLTAF